MDEIINYHEDVYNSDRNQNALLREWAVYYDGSIYGYSGRAKAGLEIPVGQEFQYAGRTFLVPAVYSCAKGLVVDFCMWVDPEEYQRFIDFWNSQFEGRDGEDLNRR